VIGAGVVSLLVALLFIGAGYAHVARTSIDSYLFGVVMGILTMAAASLAFAITYVMLGGGS
jgi:hypothetical protein